MVRHFNASIIEWALNIFNTKVADNISDQVNPVIQPTMEIKPFANIVRGVANANTGGTTIFSTPTDKDFFLTYVQISGSSLADADNTSFNAFANIDGVNEELVQVQKQTLTAHTFTQAVHFDPPIRIDRGTGITVNTAFTVGAARKSGCLNGYTVETTRSD